MAHAFFTIGHSTRSITEFFGMLGGPEVRRIIDVRKMPMSRNNPQFNRDALAAALAPAGIGYDHIAALGGLRGKAPDLPPDLNGLWTNPSFHNYADYALSTAFHDGLGALRAIGHRQTCAVMCSEAVWWRCHRRIIADYLIARGETVFHIMSADRLEPARLTPGAAVQPDGRILYPAPSTT
ncbi:MAG: DUF488 domain-containing protein [Paracoccus sp.]|jgi:uncharacterized protein (DUF488 family)|nr:DUF488 domain-containing protein [Paracoccus sp. (in: a-proteobacteria)]